MKFEDLNSTIMSVIITVIMIAVVLIPILADSLPTGEEWKTVSTILKLVPLFMVIAVLWLIMNMFINKKD